MITDLFSHKIHSSSVEWQDKLVELACVFAEFDGLPYDRSAIEDRLLSISPRASFASSLVARDASKFRDEISAYPAYLGLYHLQFDNDKWIFRLSETAKKLLVVEEPNVPAFMLLQLLLFQYPNGMGFAYSKSGGLRIQANVRNRTLQFINDGIHLSPLRLICKALEADSLMHGINSLHPRVSIDEIFILANDSRTNQKASPNIDMVVAVLTAARNGSLTAPNKVERRFHILNHTDFLQVTNGWIHLREAVSPEDAEDLQRKLQTINSITTQFNGFDQARTEYDLKSVMFDGSWSNYFDGLVSLSAETVQILANDAVQVTASLREQAMVEADENPSEDYTQIKFNYPLRQREEYITPQPKTERKRELADPEATIIKRQRSHLLHKILTQKMDEYLRNLGATPYENEHIDLYAKIPNDGSYIFEVKSVSPTNLLSQTRKGLSQLYEYRYRYKEQIGDDVVLCLVYPKEPSEIDWLEEYLCNDRNIAICWFNGDQFCYSNHCQNQLQGLIS